jgi:hypothetical protein
MQFKTYERLFCLAVGAFICGVVALFVALTTVKEQASGGGLAAYLVAGSLSFGLVAVALARRSL